MLYPLSYEGGGWRIPGTKLYVMAFARLFGALETSVA